MAPNSREREGCNAGIHKTLNRNTLDCAATDLVHPLNGMASDFLAACWTAAKSTSQHTTASMRRAQQEFAVPLESRKRPLDSAT